MTLRDPRSMVVSALSTALRDPRVGFAIKASMIGGAYEAFVESVAGAIIEERLQWQNVAEDAFDEGAAQQRKNEHE